MNRYEDQEKKSSALETAEGMNREQKRSFRFSWLVLPLILFLAGTGIYQYVKTSNSNRQLAALEQEHQRLIQEQEDLRDYVSDVTATVNEVSLKLRDIRQKQVDIQGMMSDPNSEGSQRNRMLIDLHAIQSQLVNDKRNIETLEKSMKESKVRIAGLEKMVSQLKAEIDQNRITIANLSETLQAKEYALRQTRDSLSVSRNDLEKTRMVLDESKKTLENTHNTAFYVMGKPDELKQKNIIQRHGRLWWKNDVLTSRFDIEDFNRIDIRLQSQFVLDRKSSDVKVIPARDEESYTLYDNGDNQSVLEIKDRENFWKVPYLVMVLR